MNERDDRVSIKVSLLITTWPAATPVFLYAGADGCVVLWRSLLRMRLHINQCMHISVEHVKNGNYSLAHAGTLWQKLLVQEELEIKRAGEKRLGLKGSFARKRYRTESSGFLITCM